MQYDEKMIDLIYQELNCDFDQSLEKISEMVQDPQSNDWSSDEMTEEEKKVMLESEREYKEN